MIIIMRTKKRKGGNLNGSKFRKIDYLRDWDLYNSPQIIHCRNTAKKKLIRYNCNTTHENNLKKLNFIECEYIINPMKYWPSWKEGYKHRANLIWDLSRCP